MKGVSILGCLALCLSLHACQCSDKPKVGPVTDASASPEEQFAQRGKPIFETRCAQCHQANGQGLPGFFPPLTRTEWVLGDKGRLIRLLLNGMIGPIQINGEAYDSAMPPHNSLADEQIAAVLTYVRQNFGNDAGAVAPDEVAAVRAANQKIGLWNPAELLERTGLPGE